MNKQYYIKEGYIHRTEFVTCEQMEHTDQFQKEVYEKARQICVQNSYKTVLDIGCGSAFKLANYFRDKNIIGLELEPNLSFIRKKYPLYDFRESDFNNPPEDEIDLVICSDVVEHLLEPDELMHFMTKINFKTLVLSTPERSAIQRLQRVFGWQVQENGPPYNKMHVREWSFEELNRYVSDFFNVEHQYMCPIQKECQVVIATKK